MSDKPFQPEYPKWVRQIFDAKFRCTRCGRRITQEDMISLGVAKPQADAHLHRRPRGRVYADCSKCFKPYCFEVETNRDELIEAVTDFYDHIEFFGNDDDDEPGKPFLPSPNLNHPNLGSWIVEDKIQGGDDNDEDDADDDDQEQPPRPSGLIPRQECIEEIPPDANVPFDIVPPEKSPAQKRRDSIRRRKQAALSCPMTDKEVAAFLKKLKRTSFKRSSKGWSHFMRQLGVDIHWPGGDA